MMFYVQVVLLYDYDVLFNCILYFLEYKYEIVYVMVQMEYQFCSGLECYFNMMYVGYDYYYYYQLENV